MNKIFRALSLPLLLALAASTLLCSCASAKKEHPLGYIKKADDYHLKPGVRLITEDKMILFDYMHHIYGAVEAEEYLERYGHYITVSWRGVDKSANVVLRLEYRQSTTGAELFTKEIIPDKVRGRNSSEFRVTGAEYKEGGPLSGWRVLLEVNGQVVDEYQSFLWK